MNSEPFHANDLPEIQTDAAVIHPVTPAILDEAAHKAAQMADDVAHHAVHDEPAADAAPTATGSASQMADSDAAEAAAQIAEGATEAVDDRVAEAEQAVTQSFAATGAVLAHATDAVGAAAGEAVDAASRMASETGHGLSGADDAVGRYNAALLGMMRANMAATGDFVVALAKARSVPEVVAINADHLRRQFDTLTTQGRELTRLAQTFTLDALKPLSGVVRRDG